MPIRVELELDSGNFEAGIVRANTRLQQLQNQTNGVIVGVSKLSGESKNFLSTLRDVTVILGQAGHAMENLHRVSTGWVGEIVKLNAEVERMQSLLKAMSTAADPVREATDYIKNLREEAKQAPFSLQAMHQAFIRLKAGGIDDTTQALKSMKDAVAAFGGTDEVLGRASLAFQEMSGKGVVQMKELRNQLGMAVPQAMILLARSFGTTYQQLMEDVHTGTVDAKTAIKALNLEFERVYGGAAQRQMETFNGQLARFKVIMMDLAIKSGGADDDEKGFFGTLKRQFRDLNDALSGAAGEQLAAKLGDGLTQIVLSMRKAVDVALEFKGAIADVGMTLAYGFGAQVAIAGLLSLVSTIKNVMTEIAVLRAAWAATTAAFAAGGAIAGAGSILGALSLTLGAIAPVLPVIIGGAAALAYAFGLVGSSAQSAYEQIKKFGAQSQEEIDKAKVLVTELDKKIEMFRRMRTAPTYAAGEIAKLEKDRLEIIKTIDKAQADVLSEATRKEVMRGMEEINETVRAQRAVYNAQAQFAERAHEQEVRAQIAQHRSTLNLRRQYEADVKAAALQSYDAQIAVLEQFVERYSDLLAKGDEKQKAYAGGMLEKIGGLIEQQRQLQKQTEAMEMGTFKNPKPMLDEKLFAKGEKALANLNAQMEGFKAGLQGLDPEVYELKAALENVGSMKYGDPLIEQTRELIQELLDAKENVDALHKAFRGEEQLETDETNLRVKMLRELAELRAKAKGLDLNDVDRLRLAIQAGHYPGFGAASSPMAQKIIDIRERFTEAGQKVETFGDIVKKVFGPDGTSGLDAFANKVGNLAGSFSQMGGSILGGAGSFVDKVIGAESGGNPNARASTSSAVGLGQFTEGTWMSFITQMHSDMLSLSKETILAKRTDEALMREAISWYAQTNANKLSKAGVDVTDANLYAAHFLGPAGATSALTKEDSTALASIPALAAALRSNAFLRGMTVGDFKSWSDRKMDGYLNDRRAQKYAESSQLNRPDHLPDRINDRLLSDDELAEKIGKARGEANIAEQSKELKLLLEQAMRLEDGNNKRVAALKKLIGEGKLDSSDKNSESARYKELIDLAKQLDAQEAKNLDAKKTRTAAENSQAEIKKIREEQLRARGMAWGGFGDPQSGEKNTEGFIRLENSLANHLANMKALYGEDTDEYKQAVADKAAAEQAFLDHEAIKKTGALARQTQELQRALMTEDQARYDALQKAIALDESYLQRFQGNEFERARVVEQVEEHIAALKAKFAQESPLGRQFREMTNYADNFEKVVGASMNSAIDNLAGLMTGTQVKWRDMLQSMARDFAKYMLNSVVGGFLKSMFSGAGGTQGILGSLFSGASSVVGLHTGGIVGSDVTFTRNVPMSLFAGAPRFHGGGMIGTNEVPIIAKKGEGVFTQDQMKALGGAGGNVSISVPVTLNASGGTPEQNADLSKRFGAQMEQLARGVVADEVRKQMRPGGTLATKFGR